jgi:hypothetical protein
MGCLPPCIMGRTLSPLAQTPSVRWDWQCLDMSLRGEGDPELSQTTRLLERNIRASQSNQKIKHKYSECHYHSRVD